MCRCKGKGLNGFAFFEEGMEFAAFRHALIERDLRQALTEERIEPFFQPLVSLTEGCINDYEVLARWRLHDGTLRLPDGFIPIAEDCGLIGEIYFTMLRRAAARSWPPATRLAINPSPIQFEDDTLVERTSLMLEESGFPPGQLDIEITESAFASNLEHTRIIIAQFKELGIQTALDDFGTGYSSLRHLSEFHFDKLKIDRPFITDLADNPASQTIVRTIIAMAHNLGLRVTVEGVESIENEADLLGFDCDVGQRLSLWPSAPSAGAARALLTLALATLPARPAHAGNGQVDQVERLDAEPGETEVENQLILVRRAEPHSKLLKTTFEHAVSERMQLGIEFSSQRAQGGALELTTISLQATWTLLDPEEARVGLGIQPSLEIDCTSGARGSETFFIAEVREGPFDIAVNAILSIEPGAWDDVGLFWALRADRALGGRSCSALKRAAAPSAKGRAAILPVPS